MLIKLYRGVTEVGVMLINTEVINTEVGVMLIKLYRGGSDVNQVQRWE